NMGKNLLPRLISCVLDAAVSRFELDIYSPEVEQLSSRDDFPYSSWSERHQDEYQSKTDVSAISALHQQLFRSDHSKVLELLKKDPNAIRKYRQQRTRQASYSTSQANDGYS